MKFLHLTLYFLTIFTYDLFAEESLSNVDYGNKMFEYLKSHYPQHFTLRSRTGEPVPITRNDLIGKHLISVFSEKTPVGWLHCAGRQPVGPFPSQYASGQCVFYEMLGMNHDGAEILLSHRFADKDSSSEKFWATIIFEACNAAQGKKFLEVMDDLSKKKTTRQEFSMEMLRIEYQSAQNAQKIQDKVWREFCRGHNITFSEKYWYFPMGTSFEKWVELLKATKSGRRYIENYEQNVAAGDVNAAGSSPK